MYKRLTELEKLNEMLLESLKRAIQDLADLGEIEKADTLARVVDLVEKRKRFMAENKDSFDGTIDVVKR